ncbi:2-dehydro-3-deoxy-6-phosphogalactonate aldolase [Agarilytica rhodophyticola]|uniref:2-dehydro-3-deoxy-6-phosphogalactonate aldolase n=1 Tax=Agarilytica rhodophyticola TaxID=1737490 RepID=UPI000B3441EF|nr:2-dehydro-3-deoxy-6-phosphogalactonate aldolase [Agarilytica rhodophyticola]
MKDLSFCDAIEELPLIAILRGVTPERVLDVATVIKDAGFTIIEVPLNSPKPYESISLLNKYMGEEILIGAGTVLTYEEVDKVHLSGGKIVISPNTNEQVIRYTKKLSLYSLPGFYTPTEAFKAIYAGADSLKMFPADILGPKAIKAVKAILPPTMPIFPVGGVAPAQMGEFIAAGANGFGLGSGLFSPEMNLEQVKLNASTYIAAYRDFVRNSL